MASVYASPPLLTIVGGTPAVNLPQASGGVGGVDESSTSSSSIIIVIIVIASVVIISASLYLILRYVSRRCRRSFRTYSVAEEVFSSSEDSRGERASHGQGVSRSDFIDSLPLFSFSSVTGNVAGGDCAVCLSKFELHDQLRLLPLCCHAFHADCIDTWLSSNQTCPLCRSTVHPTEPDVLNKILPSLAVEDRGNSFRIELGSISRRREPSDSGDGRRSYSVGSFEYIVDDGYEVSAESTHRRGVSDCSSVDKDSTDVATYQPEPPGQSLASQVSSGRSWLRDCVDRLAPFSLSSRALSFRSSRRSETVVPVEDLEANRIGEEISEMFRWLSGV